MHLSLKQGLLTLRAKAGMPKQEFSVMCGTWKTLRKVSFPSPICTPPARTPMQGSQTVDSRADHFPRENTWSLPGQANTDRTLPPSEPSAIIPITPRSLFLQSCSISLALAPASRLWPAPPLHFLLSVVCIFGFRSQLDWTYFFLEKQYNLQFFSYFIVF